MYTSAKSVKTTINLLPQIKQDIDRLVKQKVIKNQTDFINQALQQNLSALSKTITLTRLKNKLQNIKSYHSDISTLEAKHQVRQESMAQGTV